MFPLPATTRPAVLSYLTRAAAHLASLSHAGRVGWYAVHLPAVREWKCSAEFTAFDRAITLGTLMMWRDGAAEIAA